MAAGVYPGSFNPPTVAHLAAAAAAVECAGLERVDLAVSEVALGKEAVAVPTLDDRLSVLAAVARTRPWLRVTRTPHRLIADIARGYDAVILGADKWVQVLDPAWYGGSASRRDEAVAGLPRVLVVPREGWSPPLAGRAELLDLDPGHLPVSSSAARAGRAEWMLPEAAAFDAATGAWSDPGRYAGARGLRKPPGAAR